MNINELEMALFLFREKAKEMGLSKKAIESGENIIISRALEDSMPEAFFEPEFTGMFVVDTHRAPRSIEEISCVLEYEQIISRISEDKSSAGNS